jgi:hypothetical protein
VRSPLALLACLAAALVLAGCGTPPRYSLEKTRSCLAKAGDRIRAPKGDFVAQSATVGAFRAALPGSGGQAVTLSFGENDADAKSLADGYVRFHARNVGVSDILYLDKNVVALWRQHPTQAQLNALRDCLK